jgi:hypothetical protein
LHDSQLEGSGFELSVPRRDGLRLQAPTMTSLPRPCLGGDVGHDAGPDDVSRGAASAERRVPQRPAGNGARALRARPEITESTFDRVRYGFTTCLGYHML